MSRGAVSLGDGRVLRETDQAILVELETGEEVWIPKSVLTDDSEVWQAGQSGDVSVQQWWAEKSNLG